MKKITSLTAEQKAAIPEWNERWMKIILATGPSDREIVRKAVVGMYAAAGLPQPRVIFVPSPLVAALAGSFAAAIWWLRSKDGQEFYQKHLCFQPTKFFATRAATYAATDAATYAATSDATYAATYAATRAATSDATSAATRAATRAATSDGTSLAALVKFLLLCCENAYQNMNGGNHWASWTGFLSFWRDIVGLKLVEHEAFSHYENLSIHSGWRYTHKQFCLVSERPQVLRTRIVNGVHQAHCEDGPSHRWADGWSLWHLNGVKVDEQIVMHPETQTIRQIEEEKSNDVRALRIERFGWLRYLTESGAKSIDERLHPREGTPEKLYATKNGMRLVVIDPATSKQIALGVPSDLKSCAEAQKWLNHGADESAMCRT